MYHIKSDLRAVKSSELLFDGLMKCMEEKDFDQISITDITKKSTVSRATFYRNFDGVIDLLYWKCNQLFEQVLTDYGKELLRDESRGNLVYFVFCFWMNHSRILEILFHQGRSDIIFNSFLNNAHLVMRHLGEHYDLGLSDDRRKADYQYFIATRAGVFVGVFEVWLTNGKKETAEELSQIIERQFTAVNQSGLIF